MAQIWVQKNRVNSQVHKRFMKYASQGQSQCTPDQVAAVNNYDVHNMPLIIQGLACLTRRI